MSFDDYDFEDPEIREWGDLDVTQDRHCSPRCRPWVYCYPSSCAPWSCAPNGGYSRPCYPAPCMPM